MMRKKSRKLQDGCYNTSMMLEGEGKGNSGTEAGFSTPSRVHLSRFIHPFRTRLPGAAELTWLASERKALSVRHARHRGFNGAENSYGFLRFCATGSWTIAPPSGYYWGYACQLRQ